MGPQKRRELPVRAPQMRQNPPAEELHGVVSDGHGAGLKRDLKALDALTSAVVFTNVVGEGGVLQPFHDFLFGGQMNPESRGKTFEKCAHDAQGVAAGHGHMEDVGEA